MPTSERMGAFATPSRTRAGNGLHSAPTPRQAAIAAKKELEEEKKRQAMVIKQQREELKAAAKAKQEEIMAQQQLSLKKRAQTAQRQREAAAAARKAARERQTAAQAKELQASMKENRELKERLLKEERERRRNSVAHRNAAWSRERDLKKRLQKERQEEQKMIMEAHAVFLEAKDRLKKEQALAHRQELIWRARNKECRRRERESRDGRRRTFCEEMESWGMEIDRQMGLEEGTTHRLYRQDCEEYERCLSELKKEDEEYKRMELMRYRLFKQQEELKRKEQEAKERRIMLEDRESVLESKKKEEEAELDRREALREVPLEMRKIDIVEALWARQKQLPVAATRDRRCLQLRSVQELGTPETRVESNASLDSVLLRRVQELDTPETSVEANASLESVLLHSVQELDTAEANASLESGADSEVSIDVGGEYGVGYSDSIVSSSTSNMGASDWVEGKKNLRLEVPERDLDMEAIYCTAGLSSAPSWSESSVIEARGVTAEAAEVLAAAEQSFSSSESLDEAGAYAVASAAICSPVADSRDNSRFPVRALVFPSSPVGDCGKEAKGEEGIRGLLEKEGGHDGTAATVTGDDCSGLKGAREADDVFLCSSGNNKENSSLAAGTQGEAAESSNDGAVAMIPLTVDMVVSMDRGDGLSCPTAPSPTGSDNGDEEEVIVG